MTAEQEMLAVTFMADRVQERMLVVSGSSSSPVAKTFPDAGMLIVPGDTDAEWWPDRIGAFKGKPFDVILLDGIPGNWEESGDAVLTEALRVLRPGGMLAGYISVGSDDVGGAIVKGVVAPKLEQAADGLGFQFLRVAKVEGVCFAFRLLKRPEPGLTLCYYCDARGNDTLLRASEEMLPYADQVIVFDTGVEGDETRPPLDPDVVQAMFETCDADVDFYHVPWMNDFSMMANAIRYKAEHEWIQIFGDDCRIDARTAARVANAVADAPADIYSIQLYHRNVGPSWEVEDTLGYSCSPPRTFRNRWWIYFSGHVHEVITPAMGVAGFPAEKHNQLIPRTEAAVIHWANRPGETTAEKQDYYDVLAVKGAGPVRRALEYHAWHQKFDEEVYGSPAQASRVAAIVAGCKGSVLDLASGDGWIAAQIRDAGHELVGVEMSKIRRRRAKREYDLDLLDGDVTEPLPFEDGEFTTVAACEILEHLDNPGGCLEEMCRIASERIIVSFPIAAGFDADPHHKWGIRAEVITEAGCPQMLVLVCDKINREEDE